MVQCFLSDHLVEWDYIDKRLTLLLSAGALLGLYTLPRFGCLEIVDGMSRHMGKKM